MPLIGDLDIAAIEATKSVTATDVFVYDTSKDSDGGVWRKRTQHTSWYNETLNTSARGSRREFPAVAVIVAEQYKVTIYDGDDPSLPMWMMFNCGTPNWNTSAVFLSTQQAYTVAALNGKLVVGGSNGVPIVDFISEKQVNRGRPDLYTGQTISHKNSGTIALRNNPIGQNPTGQAGVTKNFAVNHVAMTVLPNAPIDPDTGLPVPTIAVATDGGVSVIKHDETVVDLYRTSDDDVHYVELDNNKVYMAMERGGIYIADIPTSDQSGNPNAAWTVYAGTQNDTSYLPQLRLTGGGSGLVKTEDGFAVGDNHSLNEGFNLVAEDATSTKSLVSHIRSDSNTGWMNGDIKLATLSDTDDTDVTATNLISNSTFADSSGWSLDADGNWTISGGTLNSAGTGTPSFAWPSYSFDYGKQYIIQFDISSYTSGTLELSSSTGGTTHSVTQATGTYSFSFTVTGNQIMYFRSNAFVGSVDNVYYYEAEEDRSVNGNGLRVFGTVTKNPVTTGADLVAYSGFSSSNYMVCPVSDNFGSSATMTFMGWQKISDNSDYQYFISANDLSSGRVIGMSMNKSGVTNEGAPYFYDNVNSSLPCSTRIDDGSWHFVVGVLDGTSKKLYVDGRLAASATVTSINLSNVTKYNIGFYSGTDGTQVSYIHLGDIALVRASATAPTAEQIEKIYNDEKHLFQENAKATLYGTSDAVTALAYDDDTNLLHVGTSAGRSIFQGLRRVDNTTDAVGTAISAVNGMVVEE
jgi:hypothetical protein